MRNSVIWSFFSLVALVGGGLLSGCDSDDATIRSALGESCDKTSDCADGLKCVQGTCYQTASSTGGSANNEGGDGSGGTTVVGPPPPVLGTEGESCTKRADCEDGLGCYSGRCTSEAVGEGGANSGPVGARLGKPGETCVVGSDCEKGLSCVPGGYPVGEGSLTGAGFIGICSVTTTLKPSGKTCGAECREAKDCCELPQALHVAYAVGTPYGTGASSCSELRALLGNAKCATATGATGAQCAALATYCECEKDTWSCDAGSCTYQAGCTEGKLADQPEGCPTYTRSGRGLYATCNSDGACAPEPTEVDPCKRDADCEGMMVTADPTGAVKECSEGECVCHTESGACYRKCDSDLDCDAGYNCDADTSLCTEAPACTTNEECIGYGPYQNVACDQGTCKLKCNSNLECQVASEVTALAPNYWICGEDNFCAPLGCSTDAQCAQTGVGNSRIRMFCTEPVTVEGTVIQSAITD